MNYINKYSWKSFLSTATRDLNRHNGFYWFRTRKSWQILKDRELQKSDLIFLKQLVPFNFFYFSKDETEILKTEFNISRSRDPDVAIDISGFNLSGKKYKDIRNAVNKNLNKFTILNNFRNIDDVKIMLDRWKHTCGDKYFQVRTGKNKYYFENNLHDGCICEFVYDGDKLISFAVLSPPDHEKNSSYIIGKALCLDYPGLSEFADISIYKKAQKLGTTVVNLGGGPKALIKYKAKFPGAFFNDTYDGKVHGSK